jgi:hypothetical protein
VIEIEKFGAEVPQNMKDARLFWKGLGKITQYSIEKMEGQTQKQQRAAKSKESVGERNEAK